MFMIFLKADVLSAGTYLQGAQGIAPQMKHFAWLCPPAESVAWRFIQENKTVAPPKYVYKVQAGFLPP